MEDSMVTVCQTCGDHGFCEALIYCVECKVAAEHRYCLDRPPKPLDGDVVWTCEDCLSSVNEDCTFDTLNPTQLATIDHMCIRSIKAAQATKSSPSLLCFRKEASQNDDSELPEVLDHNSDVHAQPILEPIWRGSFGIKNEDFEMVNGLAAYLSTQACSLVDVAARLLPGSLPVELLPRLEVLPKGFAGSYITDRDIGLYFFPEKERDERAFDKLLGDMIDGDLAMKAVFNHAELLLFTSRQLPLQNWSNFE